MKARGQALRLKIDVPAACLCCAPRDQLEQAVARAHVPVTVRLDNEGRTRPTDAGVDDAEKRRARRKPLRIGRQQIGGRLGIAGRRVGEEIDDGNARRHLMQYRLHLSGIGALQPEVGEQYDHAEYFYVVVPVSRMRCSAKRSGAVRR